jgi:hypothetical protein
MKSCRRMGASHSVAAFTARAISRSSFDCAHQCCKTGPQPKTQDSGPYGATTTIYDPRYIACLQAFPGIPNPLPLQVFASQTTAAGPLPTLTLQSILAGFKCSAANGLTLCGDECCVQDTSCYYWEIVTIPLLENHLALHLLRRGARTLGFH